MLDTTAGEKSIDERSPGLAGSLMIVSIFEVASGSMSLF